MMSTIIKYRKICPTRKTIYDMLSKKAKLYPNNKITKIKTTKCLFQYLDNAKDGNGN